MYYFLKGRGIRNVTAVMITAWKWSGVDPFNASYVSHIPVISGDFAGDAADTEVKLINFVHRKLGT